MTNARDEQLTKVPSPVNISPSGISNWEREEQPEKQVASKSMYVVPVPPVRHFTVAKEVQPANALLSTSRWGSMDCDSNMIDWSDVHL